MKIELTIEEAQALAKSFRIPLARDVETCHSGQPRQEVTVFTSDAKLLEKAATRIQRQLNVPPMPKPKDKLGSTQEEVLVLLKRFDGWPGGWVWRNQSNTIRILSALVKKGYVKTAPSNFGHPYYHLTQKGLDHVGNKS